MGRRMPRDDRPTRKARYSLQRCGRLDGAHDGRTPERCFHARAFVPRPTSANEDDARAIDERCAKLYVVVREALKVDRSSAQVTKYYAPDGVVGRQVAAVVNFPTKQIGKFMSEVLVLGFPDAANEVVMIGVDHAVPNGGRLF